MMSEILFSWHKFDLTDGWSFNWDESMLSQYPKAMPLTAYGDFFIQLVHEYKLIKPFRYAEEFLGVNYLFSIFPQKKTIILCSQKLFYELNAISYYSSKDYQDKIQEILNISDHDGPTEWEISSFRLKLPRVNEDLNNEISSLMEEISGEIKKYPSSLFEKFSDYGLTLTANFDLLRVHLLKFLALLPSLDHDKDGHEVKRTLFEALRRLLFDHKKRKKVPSLENQRLPREIILLLKLAYQLVVFLPASLTAKMTRFLVKNMAKRFIAGESIEDSINTLKTLKTTNREATLDQLGELVVSFDEAENYFKKVLEIIEGLTKIYPNGEKNKAHIYCAHVSIKVSALSHDFKAYSFDSAYKNVAPRLKEILLQAKKAQVFINIDAEHYHYRDFVFDLYAKVLLETPELGDYAQTGIVVQAYLQDAGKHLDDIIELAQKRKIMMPIRLVKGAYWDAETIEGEAHGFKAPQYLNKCETDLNFLQMAEKILLHKNELQLTIGSHNLYDHCYIEVLKAKKYPDAPVIEHQCLHMTYEALSVALTKKGWPVRNYMPVGNLLIGMAYLVRRIMENSSQVGVLAMMRSHQNSTLIKSPLSIFKNLKEQKKLAYSSVLLPSASFKNISPLRLYKKENLRALEEKLNMISLSQIEIKEDAPSDVSLKMESLYQSFKDKKGWCSFPLEEKQFILLKAARLMTEQRLELSSLIVLEAHKTRTEALADVDEAIDFIHFYAKEMMGVDHLVPRGVIGVIAPWNFPLAIPCGMLVGALAAGNHVILKPADQTPKIATLLCRLLWLAGVPFESCQLAIGAGAIVGSAISDSPRLSGLVFTGSKAVGFMLFKKLSSKLIEHPWTKQWQPVKVIVEMGGKNAVIVTQNAELDETVSGIVYSALAHAGQKCSAASRILVDNELKDVLISRLKKAFKDVNVGLATDSSTLINPLISKKEAERVKQTIKEIYQEAAQNKGVVHADFSSSILDEKIVGPVLVEYPAGVNEENGKWLFHEIFAPIVHIVGYYNLNHAVDLFNQTQYGLTGGIFSQSEDDIEFLLKNLKAGNLYINRPNTGARVGIEPFGGFKMSGTGPKAGSQQYLKSFVFSPDQIKDVKTLEDESFTELHLPQTSLHSENNDQDILRIFLALQENVERFILHESSQVKKIISSHLLWLKTSGTSFLNKKHQNTTIPGQLSFDDLNLKKKDCLAIFESSELDRVSFLFLINSLVSGNHLYLLCANQKIFELLEQFSSIVKKAKPSWDGWTLVRGKQNINSMSSQLTPELIFIHSSSEGVKAIINSIFDLFPHSLPQLISSLEYPELNSPQDWLELFVHRRSLAINTMRHGAPLKIEGQE